jgi:flagellar biosynthesis/type III secretory pathway protein FliH
MEQYKKLHSLVITLEDDFRKFYEKGNKAAGTRVRQGMQRLKGLAQEIRTDVQEIKNADS